ncbi:hypothetical protein Nmel_013996 [Mimus melanotis]
MSQAFPGFSMLLQDTNPCWIMWQFGAFWRKVCQVTCVM